jgi:hypothetical protein
MISKNAMDKGRSFSDRQLKVNGDLEEGKRRLCISDITNVTAQRKLANHVSVRGKPSFPDCPHTGNAI